MRKGLSKVLVTGGAGFIGSEFVRQIVKAGYPTIVIDKLTYAGDLARLKEIEGRYKFYKADIRNEKELDSIFAKEKPQILVHFAAETHVDRSILDSLVFFETNVIGTKKLLDLSQRHRIKKFIHISTDEVYGEIKRGRFCEDSPLLPNSPYAASKAAADLLIKSYIRTYDFPAIIVRPTNNYGPWQYPEKLIPVIIFKALNGEKVPIYAKGLNIREWLYFSDCARGILSVVKKGRIGEVYNLGSQKEKRNIDVVKNILKTLGKSEGLMKFVKDRPGHDYRYSLNCAKICRLGWKPKINFKEGLRDTINWYIQNQEWLETKIKGLKHYWNKVYKNAR